MDTFQVFSHRLSGCQKQETIVDRSLVFVATAHAHARVATMLSV